MLFLQKQVDWSPEDLVPPGSCRWPLGLWIQLSCYFLALLGDGELRLTCGVSFQDIVKERLSKIEVLC